MQSKKNPPRTAEGRISMTQTLRRVDRLLLRSRRILSRGGPSPGPLMGRPGPVPMVAPMRARRSHRFRRLGACGGSGRLVGLAEGSNRRNDTLGSNKKTTPPTFHRRAGRPRAGEQGENRENRAAPAAISVTMAFVFKGLRENPQVRNRIITGR